MFSSVCKIERKKLSSYLYMQYITREKNVLNNFWFQNWKAWECLVEKKNSKTTKNFSLSQFVLNPSLLEAEIFLPPPHGLREAWLVHLPLLRGHWGRGPKTRRCWFVPAPSQRWDSLWTPWLDSVEHHCPGESWL